MLREQQDKIWNELSEESKDYVLSKYNSLEVERCKADRDTKLDYEDLFGSHNLNSTLTYEDVVKELFPELREGVTSVEIPTFSEEEANKLSAIGALLATAKYLNKGWKPDWKSSSKKWSFDIDNGKLIISHSIIYQTSFVYFRTKELAQQAIQILGEEVIRLALTTDY